MAAVLSISGSGVLVGMGLGKMVAGKIAGRVTVADEASGWAETAVGFERVEGRSLVVLGQTQLMSTKASKVISRGIIEYQKRLLCHRFFGSFS